MSDDNITNTTNDANPRPTYRDGVNPELLAQLGAIFKDMSRAADASADTSASTGADAAAGEDADVAFYRRLRSVTDYNEPDDPSGPFGLGAETVRRLDSLVNAMKERYSGLIDFDDDNSRLDNLREPHDTIDLGLEADRPTEDNSASLLALGERSGFRARNSIDRIANPRNSIDRIANLLNAEIRAMNEREGNGGNVSADSGAPLADATAAVENPVDGTAADKSQSQDNRDL